MKNRVIYVVKHIAEHTVFYFITETLIEYVVYPVFSIIQGGF